MPLATGTGAFLWPFNQKDLPDAQGDPLHGHAGLLLKTGLTSWKNVKDQRVFLNLNQLTGRVSECCRIARGQGGA
ncbi:hypothetical protein [Aeromonas media]|uniref:hypothetical protein n=1 Tax=Aeromonas media TaxID=651 RepID=UPI003D261C8E